MRKIKEVLRLRFGLGLHQDQIARSCSIGQATVHRYLEKAAAANLVWSLPDDLDEQQLDQLLFPARPLWKLTQLRPGIDFAQLHTQMQTHKHVTLQLLWEEYREVHPDGYGSRFCELYQRWNRTRDVVLRQDHKPGEKMFVDWAGDTVPVYDRKSGEAEPASIFVAVLGASTYTFSRAARGQALARWIDCHVQAFEFFGGATKYSFQITRGPGSHGRVAMKRISIALIMRCLRRTRQPTQALAGRPRCGTTCHPILPLPQHGLQLWNTVLGAIRRLRFSLRLLRNRSWSPRLTRQPALWFFSYHSSGGHERRALIDNDHGFAE